LFGNLPARTYTTSQNQGDQAGSQWWNQNGIWQDGAVAEQREDGTLFVCQVRFNSQADKDR